MSEESQTRLPGEAEMLYRTLFEQSPDGILVVDEDGRFLEFNEAAHRQLGYTREEFKQLWIADLDPFVSPGQIRAHLREILRQGGAELEVRHRTKQGEIREMRIIARVIDLSGRRVFHTICRDVTAAGRAESELRGAMRGLEEQNAKMEAIIEGVGEAISIRDRNFRLTYQNRIAVEIMGDRVGEICYQAFHGRAGVCEGCPALRSFQDGRIHSTERSLVTARGLEHFLVTAAPFRCPDGEITGAIEIARNITARKQAEEALRQSEERFRLIADFTHDWEYWVGPDGRCLYSSPACERITGYTAEDFQRDPRLLLALVHPEDQGLMEGHLRRHLGENRERAEIEFRIISRQGEERWISHVCQSVYGESGKWLGRRASNRDITQRKRSEEELQKVQRLESIGLLAGGIAHDFNNILTAIMGNIELAKMFLPPGEKVRERLAVAARASLRARGIAHQLLTFAKGGDPIKKVLQLPQLLREAGDLALRGARVKAEYLLPDDLWRVEADAGQLTQVLSNLAINACQAMPEGGILRIVAGNREIEADNPFGLGTGRFVAIEVIDQGTGIPEEHLGKIFDPYFTTKENGSGLGLSISHSIIKKHGGAITASSRPGKGSTFTVHLPATGKVRLHSRQAASDWEPWFGAGRVLILDDEESVHDITAEMLNYLGYVAEVVAEGSEAVSAYREALAAGNPFVAVIADLTIPAGIGGRETARLLLEMDPKARIIVSSGYADDPVMVDFEAHGFRAAIPKPYKLSELGRVLRQAIGQGGHAPVR